MIICEVDSVREEVAPPTPDAIELDRQRQMDVLKSVRRQLNGRGVLPLRNLTVLQPFEVAG